MIRLSVLIPAIPNRTLMALKLYAQLQKQVDAYYDWPVEILLLLDNKKRTIGKKREALVQVARGDYVAFVDDDDWVDDNYMSKIVPATLRGADVIVFDTLSSINGSTQVRCQHSLAYDNEEFSQEGFKRKPWQMHAWRRTIAQAHEFPDLQYGEDWGWCSQLCAEAKTEVRVEGALYHYRYNDSVTEAK